MVLQILLGGLSGLYVVFRLFKQGILGLLGVRSDQPPVADQPPTQQVPHDEDEEVQYRRSA